MNFNFTQKYKLAIFLSLIALNGCTLFQPHVDSKIQPYTGIDPNDKHFPKLRDSISKVENIRVHQVEYGQKEITVVQNSLKVTSFGALAATGIGALYSAGSSLLLGLGTGGVTTYLFGNTFFNDTKAHLYRDANNSLICVINTGNALVSAEESLNPLLSNAPILTSAQQDFDLQKLDLDSANKCNDPQKQAWNNIKNDWDNVKIAKDQLDNKLATFEARDSEAANIISDVSSKILQALNTNIDNNATTWADIFKATNSVTSLAKGAVGQNLSPTPPTNAGGFGGQNDNSPEKLPAICSVDTAKYTRHINVLSAEITRINDAIDKAVNNFSGIGNSCAANPVTIAPLNANPNKISVSPSSSPVYVTLSGGKKTFSQSWKDNTPQGVTALFSPTFDSLIIIVDAAKLGANKPGDYKLTITDNLTAPQSVDITITIGTK